MRWILAVAAAVFGLAAYAQDVGQIKNAKGAVHVEREGKRIPATAGMGVRSADPVVAGADGAVGVTFLDNTMVSAGPSTVFSIESYRFDSTTHDGQFDAALKKGSLAVVSGKMVKQTPGSMRGRTPSGGLGVGGEWFLAV